MTPESVDDGISSHRAGMLLAENLQSTFMEALVLLLVHPIKDVTNKSKADGEAAKEKEIREGSRDDSSLLSVLFSLLLLRLLHYHLI